MSAAATDLLQKVGLSTATTLSAPGYTAGATSVTVGSTTNWPSDTGITFAIDTVTVVNGVEVQDAGSYNEFEGTVATGTSVTGVSWADGNGDQNYSAGTTTRVYIPVSKTRENRIVTWGLTHADQAGNLAATGGTLTSPKVITSINDTNNNELFKVTATGSAVNEFTVANAATGNSPTLSVTGGDSNISATIAAKGTGNINIPALRFSGARVKRATSQTGILASTTTTVSWTGEDFDTDTYHDNSTNPSRLTVPTTGVYSFGCHVEWDAWDTTTTQYRLIIQIFKNGSLLYDLLDDSPTNNAGETAVTVHDLLFATAADYFEFKVFQGTPNTRALTTASYAWVKREGI